MYDTSNIIKSIPVSANTEFALFGVVDNGHAVSGFIDENGIQSVRKTKIHTDSKGNRYIKRLGVKLYTYTTNKGVYMK